MSFSIKSVINHTRLTAQVKQLKAAFSAIANCSSNSVTTMMIKHGIVPDVIPEAPTEELEIEYPSGGMVLMGNELRPIQVKDKPILKFSAVKSAYYTLIMTDPDAPCHVQPIYREWHHWLVVNIPGNNTSKGEVLSEYIGSAPPPDTGLHRYVFLVYRQPGKDKIEFDEPRLTNRSTENRAKFSTSRFAFKYGFKAPIAGNFFVAEYDDYVPIAYKALGMKESAYKLRT